MNGYKIRNDYRHREACEPFNDTPFTDEYQKQVYIRAAALARSCGLQTVYDIGCGSGYKLMNYLGFLETIGTEVEPTLTFLKATYPDRQWQASNFEERLAGTVDLVVCSDVIEHLVEPDELMEFIGRLDFRVLFLSTPDRDGVVQCKKADPQGPPQNPFHIREWNRDEFVQYAGQFVDILGSFAYDAGIGQCLIATRKIS